MLISYLLFIWYSFR